jgi:hypothetical protein
MPMGMRKCDQIFVRRPCGTALPSDPRAAPRYHYFLHAQPRIASRTLRWHVRLLQRANGLLISQL